MKILKILLLIILVQLCFAQRELVRSKFNKKEYMIPMRDGIKLHTTVYIPKNNSKKYPILMIRTPYSSYPYGEDKYPGMLGPSKTLMQRGYIFVIQDVRGKFMSEGKYVNMRPIIKNKKNNEIDETTDTYDTIDWLIKNIPNNNGRVGMWGISYPGFYAAVGAVCNHPALKAVSPQAPIADWFIDDDMHHNGALTLPMVFNFFSSFGQKREKPTPNWPKRMKLPNVDQYNFFLNLGPLKNINLKYFNNKIDFWNKVIAHPNYDEFWQSRNTLPHFNNVKPAVMVVGGWFDSEDLYGAINTYKSIEEKNKDNKNIFVIGPWHHGGWSRANVDHFGDIRYGFNTSAVYRDSIEAIFFEYYLKDKGEFTLPEAFVFDTGKKEFFNFLSWPPKKTEKQKIYLNTNNSLTFNEPVNIKPDYLEYVSDPQNPVPYTSDFIAANRFYNRTYLNEDQRFAATRPDVVEFNSKPLTKEITIAGPIDIEFYVSTSGTDSDWVVKLIDVFPDTCKLKTRKGLPMGGYQMLLRGDILRGKYRNSFTTPEPFVPNRITKITFRLQDILHTFLKGHKIMIQVQSSWFPFFDMNPQKFVNIYTAEKSDFIKATQRIYFSKEKKSHICVEVMK